MSVRLMWVSVSFSHFISDNTGDQKGYIMTRLLFTDALPVSPLTYWSYCDVTCDGLLLFRCYVSGSDQTSPPFLTL